MMQYTNFDNIEVSHEWAFENVRSIEQWTHGYHRYPAKFLPNVVKKIIEDYAPDCNVIADLFAGYLVRVNYKKDVIRGKYLNYILNSEPIRQHGFSVMVKSINQANISASLLAQYETPLPSLKDQDDIISKLEVIEDIKKRSRLLIDNASSRKQAILDKYLK